VLVMRETTERPEAVEAGTAKLIGTTAARIVAAAGELLESPDAYAAMANAVNPFGDGQAATRIAQIVEHYLAQAPRQESP
jgi:UDP-N-acetylglucosamine 2-epimerase (non-hydrolysing)